MRLQTLRLVAGQNATVLTDTPWHEDASNDESYRDRLKHFLGGFFERDAAGMQPKPELLGDPTKPIPDAVRLMDDAGRVIGSYDLNDLTRDTGTRITPPSQADADRS